MTTADSDIQESSNIIQKLKNDVKEVEQFRKQNSMLVIEMEKLKTEKEASDEKMKKEKDYRLLKQPLELLV